MPAIAVNQVGIPEGLLNLRPAVTASQVAVRREADYAMDEKYAGNYVAYVDVWAGDQLDRTIVAHAGNATEFRDQLANLRPELRARVQLTQIPGADTFSAPSVWLA